MNNDWDIFRYPDIHSHVAGEGRVLSVDFTTDQAPTSPGQPYTLGVHPWNAARNVDWNAFEGALADHRIVGIGEAGLDTLKGPAEEQQTEVFMRQAALAEKHRLPLVIHSVRSNHRILQLYLTLRPSVPWIIHGFRGKEQEALQLLQHGIHLSLGRHRNPEVERLPFPGLIHNESDAENSTQ